jgi:hypothetical protein
MTKRAATPARRADSLLDGEGFRNPKSAGTWGALAPLDRKAVDAERVWGSVDRLLTLVSPETARKFRTVQSRLNAAIEGGDEFAVDAEVAILMRGYDALVREAVANGHAPLDSSRVWVIEEGATLFVVGMTDFDAHAAAAHLDHFKRTPEDKPRVYSIDELIRLALFCVPEVNGTLDKIKERFPGAMVVRASESRPEAETKKVPPCDFAAGGDSLDGVLPDPDKKPETQVEDDW